MATMMQPQTSAAAGRPQAIDRRFDYTQQVLVAVQLGAEPRKLTGMPDSYSVFRRLSIRELIEAFKVHAGASAGPAAGQEFERVLDEHMGYWEKRVPSDQQCYVHYAIGAPEVIARATSSLEGQPWTLLGTYHIEPQSSSYPFGFPMNPVPDHWNKGEARTYTDESVFWFNFFPAQEFLFEKTFIVWANFVLSQVKERGECNQLVASNDRPRVEGVDEFVQVNLNRFTNLNGFFASARGAGESTFTVDPDYRWYGMLLRRA